MTRQEKYAEAIKMLETALDEIDQADAALLDLGPEWRGFCTAAFEKTKKLRLEVQACKIEDADEESAPEPECTCVQVDADVFNTDGCALCNPNSPYNRRAA